MTKKILILGGGTGGVVSALRLSEKINHYGIDAEITLINKDEWHYMPPLWMDVAIEGMPIEETRAPIKGLEKYGVNVVIGPAADIDLANRKVKMEDGKELDYDYLIIALGTRNGWEAYPGLAEAGYHNYDPDAAQEMYKALKQFKAGKLVVLAPEIPYRCGIYPMEVATYLGHYYHTRGMKVDIHVITPYMPNGFTTVQALGPDIGRLWLKYFKKYNIKFTPHKGLKAIDPKAKRIEFVDGSTTTYDFLIKVPPMRLPKILDKPELVFEQDKRFTKVRALDFRHPEYKEVFLIGSHAMPPTGLADAGVFIHSAAVRATGFLLDDLAGVGEIEDFPPVTCVAYVGDKGFMGVCEVEYQNGMYVWNKCYNAMESGLMKLVKRSFYQGWLDRLRLP
ncbi:MAG: FAD-dependent oxidoreductase [Desulfurococcales archaeon]|nr:FAD-dependent oxidoreductase [Desulfurococcales archaeon]